MRVLTATSHGFAPAVEALWQSVHGSLAREASPSGQTVFAGANHNLELDRVREVTEVILSLVPASKN